MSTPIHWTTSGHTPLCWLPRPPDPPALSTPDAPPAEPSVSWFRSKVTCTHCLVTADFFEELGVKKEKAFLFTHGKSVPGRMTKRWATNATQARHVIHSWNRSAQRKLTPSGRKLRKLYKWVGVELIFNAASARGLLAMRRGE